MAKKADHIHCYERAILGKNRDYLVYKCTLPGCTHYSEPALVEGRLGLCTKCFKEIRMDKYQLSLQKPHCISCTVRRKKSEVDINRIADVFENENLPVFTGPEKKE